MKRALLALALLLAPAAAWAAPFVQALFYVAGLLSSVTVIKAVLTVAVLIYGAASQRRKARKAQAAAKAAYNASLSDRGITVLGSGAPPWRIVRGRATVGCEIHAIFTTDKQGFREDGAAYTRPDAIKHLVCVFADHESHAFHDLQVDGVSLGVLDVTGRPTSGEFFFTRKEPRQATIGGGGSVTVGQAVDTVVKAYTRDGTGEGGNFTDVTGSISLSGSNFTINGPANAVVEYLVNADLATVQVHKHLGSPGDGSADSFLVNATGGAALSAQFNTNGDLEGWAVTNGTAAVASGLLRITGTAADPFIRRASLSIAGATYRTVRARIKRIGGAGWLGQVTYVTGGHGESLSFRKVVSQPTYDADGFAVVEWDMANLTAGGTDWITSTITQVTIELGNTSADIFDIDWIDVIKTDGTWVLNDRLKDKTYAVVSLDLENVRFQGGVPGITADLSGRKLYDPRKDSTNGGSGAHRTNDTRTWEWTDNAALHVRDEITALWGHEAAHADVNDAYTIEAANDCDVRASASVQAHSQAFTVDAGTDLIIFANPELYGVGDGVRVSSSGTLPAPLAAGTTYYVVRLGCNDGVANADKQFALATTVANAYAGNRINITSAGTGTHTCTWHDYATYKVNGASTTDQAKEAVLEDLCEAMAGTAAYGARWEIQAGAWKASVMDLVDDDLHGQIEIVQADVGMDQLVNSARGQYIPTGKATATEFDNYSNATLVSADGRELWTDLALPFTDSKVRARNLCRIRVEQSRNGQIIKYPAKLKAWPLQRGDRFRVTSGEYGFSLKTYRLTDWQFGVTSPVLLIGQEDDSTVWDLADQATVDQTPNTDLPSPWVVQSITLGTPVADETTGRYTSDGTWIPRIKVTWSAVTGAYLADGTGRIVVRWRTASGLQWQQIEVKSNELGTHIEGVREGAPVLIEAYAINGLQQRGPSSFAALYVDVTGNGVVGGGNMLANSAFSADSNADGVPDSWSSFTNGTTGSVTHAINTGGAVGQRYVHVEATNLGTGSSDQAGLTQTVNLSGMDGKFITLSDWVQGGATGLPDLRLQLNWYDAANGGGSLITSTTATFTSPDATWRRYTKSIEVPSGALSVKVYALMIARKSSAGSTALNIGVPQLEPGSVQTGWAPRADELLPGVVTTPILAADSATTTGKATSASGTVTATIIGATTPVTVQNDICQVDWTNNLGYTVPVQFEASMSAYVTRPANGNATGRMRLIVWTTSHGSPVATSTYVPMSHTTTSSSDPKFLSAVAQYDVANGVTVHAAIDADASISSAPSSGDSSVTNFNDAVCRYAAIKR